MIFKSDIKREDWRPKRLKYTIEGGIEISGTIVVEEDDSIFEHEINNVKLSVPPSEDLTSSLQAAQSLFAKMMSLSDADIILDSEEFGATAAQKKIFTKLKGEKYDEVEIIGIEIKGKGSGQYFEIIANYKDVIIKTKSKVLVNTGPELFNNPVQPIIERIVDEFFKYTFEDKRFEDYEGAKIIDGTGAVFLETGT